jgi:murein DD-endopeptidase MepM/ murein hydrolase activator NlpD
LGNTPQLPKSRPDGTSDPEAIRTVARQFESVFLHQVFKSMRATVPKEGMMGAGFGGEVFTDMLDQQYAEIASRSQSFGLADAIAMQLGADTPAPGATKGAEEVRRKNAQRAYGENGAPGAWNAPVQGEIITGFGPRRTMSNRHPKMHTGVDIAAPEGTDIHASQSGRVTFAGELGEYGQTIILDHGQRSSTLYGQAGELLVKAGDEVKAGASIARVGSGQNGDRPHVHFEVRERGQLVDPSPMIGK